MSNHQDASVFVFDSDSSKHWVLGFDNRSLSGVFEDWKGRGDKCFLAYHKPSAFPVVIGVKQFFEHVDSRPLRDLISDRVDYDEDCFTLVLFDYGEPIPDFFILKNRAQHEYLKKIDLTRKWCLIFPSRTKADALADSLRMLFDEFLVREVSDGIIELLLDKTAREMLR